MSKSYAAILHDLCHDYMSHKINFEDYRRKRKMLLIKVDEQFNGASQPENEGLTAPANPMGAFGIPDFRVDSEDKKY